MKNINSPHTDPIARSESFRAKNTPDLSFRILKITARLESFRALKLSNLVMKIFEKQSEQLEMHFKRVIIKLAREF